MVKDFFEFKYKFILQKLLWIFKKEPAFIDEFLFVSQVGTEDWILGAKAKRLSRFLREKAVYFLPKNLRIYPMQRAISSYIKNIMQRL